MGKNQFWITTMVVRYFFLCNDIILFFVNQVDSSLSTHGGFTGPDAFARNPKKNS